LLSRIDQMYIHGVALVLRFTCTVRSGGGGCQLQRQLMIWQSAGGPVRHLRPQGQARVRVRVRVRVRARVRVKVRFRVRVRVNLLRPQGQARVRVRVRARVRVRVRAAGAGKEQVRQMNNTKICRQQIRITLCKTTNS
jgi:hypothetical protein